MRELIARMITDARRPPRTAANDVLHADDPVFETDRSLGAQAVRAARLAAALHISQAAPLIEAMRGSHVRSTVVPPSIAAATETRL